MTAPQFEIQLIAVVVAVSCALPGTFLVLRRMAMMSDAISHSILFGIVVAFFVVRDLSSPFLVVAAALTGVLTVSLVELLNRTGLVREDAAIGLTFPALFSVGVILVSRYAGSVHLDTDSVLLGELAFAPFNRLAVMGYDIGPRAFYLMAGIMLLNILFIAVFYKELKLATFDASLAGVLGFLPGFLHYALMALVSVTAVGAFDAVGSILVVALMIAPPTTAYLLVDRLSLMLAVSALLGAVSAISGYWIAHVLDASIAGSMASMAGLLFGAAYLAAPGRGLIAITVRRVRQRWKFAQTMLLVHLYNHEGLPAEVRENRIPTLHEHLKWDHRFAERVVAAAGRQGLVESRDRRLLLTDRGRRAAREAMVG
ncbi:MAG TPA: zinc ABC transporter permease [Deltaproteobacteria bacterium]|nr:MAG: zinc ABC transporter permease [Deltaproteobacteria bacterium GWA2_65_63]OGP27468.1 MAG: zinc ABC transporter permease [Deltaproteobacteria bacterium GWB2_65_81]OGP39479.1 MAG: zinc ABC transporter permease [Deltaproteobacteria bacterium GWC2_66_88]HAM31940.1 zinc ABC transporter permease [Deltaproteobacteria bacterium]HBG73732.1 zinc ABC transporter permease [Deltaproteobacteria bacterium]